MPTNIMVGGRIRRLPGGRLRNLPTRVNLPATLLCLALFTTTGYLMVLQWRNMLDNDIDRFDMVDHIVRWKSDNQSKLADLVIARPVIPQYHTFMLIVVVPSRPTDTAWRSAIRRTWGLDMVKQNPVIFLMFVIGVCPKQPDVTGPADVHIDYRSSDACQRSFIESEAATNNDIIYFNIEEGHRSLTEKLLLAYRFLYQHVSVQFVVKSDQDVLINMTSLLKSVVQANDRRLPPGAPVFLGVRVTDDGPQRPQVGPISGGPTEDSRWALTEDEFFEDTFPPYLNGAMYVFEGNLLTLLVRRCPKIIRPIVREDVYFTGLCRQAALPKSSVPLLIHQPGMLAKFETLPSMTSSTMKNASVFDVSLCLTKDQIVTIYNLPSAPVLEELWQRFNSFPCNFNF